MWMSIRFISNDYTLTMISQSIRSHSTHWIQSNVNSPWVFYSLRPYSFQNIPIVGHRRTQNHIMYSKTYSRTHAHTHTPPDCLTASVWAFSCVSAVAMLTGGIESANCSDLVSIDPCGHGAFKGDLCYSGPDSEFIYFQCYNQGFCLYFCYICYMKLSLNKLTVEKNVSYAFLLTCKHQQ